MEHTFLSISVPTESTDIWCRIWHLGRCEATWRAQHVGPSLSVLQLTYHHITQRCSGLLQMIPGMQHATSRNSVLAQAKHVALEFPSRTAQLLYIQSECGQVECPVLIKASVAALFQKKPKKPKTVTEHGHHDHPKLPCVHQLHM